MGGKNKLYGGKTYASSSMQGPLYKNSYLILKTSYKLDTIVHSIDKKTSVLSVISRLIQDKKGKIKHSAFQVRDIKHQKLNSFF